MPSSSSASPGDAPKYQPSVIAAAAQPSEKSGTAPALPPSDASVDEAITAELERLKAEYATYRRRAIEMLKEKDDQVRFRFSCIACVRVYDFVSCVCACLPKAVGLRCCGFVHASHLLSFSQLQKSSDQIRTLTALSASSSGYAHSASLAVPPPSSRSSVHSDGDSSSWKVDTLASEATREYLKNILLRYLSSHDAQVRAQLEAAIAAIMEFTPAEISRVQVRDCPLL